MPESGVPAGIVRKHLRCTVTERQESFCPGRTNWVLKHFCAVASASCSASCSIVLFRHVPLWSALMKKRLLISGLVLCPIVLVSQGFAQASMAVTYEYAKIAYPGAILTLVNGINNHDVVVGLFFDS